MTNVGVVVPVGPGREENLRACLASLECQTVGPYQVLVVFDGPESAVSLPHRESLSHVTLLEKHTPGQEQPRNAGVRALDPRCEAVWFVDCDILLAPDALERMLEKWRIGRVVIGPYDWLLPGQRTSDSGLHNDPRWAMFEEERWRDPEYESVGQLNVGLGCFSGNLLWDRKEFERVGGFWNELHHGRAEDGELGLRAVAHRIPIAIAPEARGWHLEHPVNVDLALERNERDVPMLNARHPWVQDEGLHIVEEDGLRFDQTCPRCGESVNSILYWQHVADHEAVPAP